MRGLGITALIVAAISLILGIISRLMMMPLPFAPTGIQASAFLAFTNTCLLAAIAFAVLGKK